MSMFPRGPLILTGQESAQNEAFSPESYFPVADVVDTLKDLSTIISNDMNSIYQSTGTLFSSLSNTLFDAVENDQFVPAILADDATPDENTYLLKPVSGYGSCSYAQHRFTPKESKTIDTKPTRPVSPPKPYGSS